MNQRMKGCGKAWAISYCFSSSRENTISFFGSNSDAVYVSLSGDAHYLAVGVSAESVPGLIGLTTAAANAAITAAGLTSFGGTPMFNCDQAGKVLSQSPAAGTLAGPRAAVSFTVGSRRDPKNPRHVCE